MKRYLKEHKIVVAATILMLIIIVIAFFAKQAFFSNSGNAVYGDRLDGIEAVEVDSKQKKEIISNLENDSSVKKATYKLQGKIINVIIRNDACISYSINKQFDFIKFPCV